MVRLTGVEQAVAAAEAFIMNKIAEVEKPPDRVVEVQAKPAPEDVAFELRIEQSFVGFILGKGGEQVKRIKAQTGADISIDQSTKEEGYSIARISRGPGADVAKTLLESRIELAQEATLQHQVTFSGDEIKVPQAM
eukprot:7016330-Pyramimonas_sp.AAC.1